MNSNHVNNMYVENVKCLRNAARHASSNKSTWSKTIQQFSLKHPRKWQLATEQANTN